MKTTLCVVLCTLWGCEGGSVRGALLLRDGLLVSTAERLSLCALEPPPAVGSAAFAANPECEALVEWERPVQWSAGGQTVVYREAGAPSYREDTPQCRSNTCADLLAIDLQSCAAAVVVPAGPVHRWRAGDGWVVWSDLRHDENGLCHSPPGDADCAVDLYGLDLASGVEHRLTARSTLLPPSAWGGEESFDVTGREVVYVDRRGADAAACFGFEPAEPAPGCATGLFAIDLETRAERSLVAPRPGVGRPRAGGRSVVFHQRLGAGQAELVFTASTGAERSLGPAGLDAVFTHDGEWLVRREELEGRGHITAENLRTGAQRVLSVPGESASAPLLRGDTVVWSDSDRESFVLFDLARGARRALLELR